ncbi:hypothetical protein D3C78_1086760 [compost metagenome]
MKDYDPAFGFIYFIMINMNLYILDGNIIFLWFCTDLHLVLNRKVLLDFFPIAVVSVAHIIRPPDIGRLHLTRLQIQALTVSHSKNSPALLRFLVHDRPSYALHPQMQSRCYQENDGEPALLLQS